MSPRRAPVNRLQVQEALADAGDFRSAQDLHALMRAGGSGIGLTTVYRHLQQLVADGCVDTLQNADGETVYRRCVSAGHHHHLVCRSCGKTVEVEGKAVERWAEKTAADHGFTQVGHTAEVFGRCARCG